MNMSTTYVELVQAEDAQDGAINVVIEGSLDITIPGTYILTYIAKDGAGNSTTATRIVIIQDQSRPVITLNGTAFTGCENLISNTIDAPNLFEGDDDRIYVSGCQCL
jgi:ABC-type branched-subunit amino acid transport system ATPase component